MNISTKDKWGKIALEERETEKIAGRSTTFFQDVVYQFTRRKSAVISLVIVVLLVLIAVFGPIISKRQYDVQNLAHINTAPRLKTYEISGKYYYISSNQKLAEVAADGTLLSALPRIKDDVENKRFVYEVDNITVYLDYKQNPPVLEQENGEVFANTKNVWNKLYPLGTDALGRDVFIRLLYGARISLLVAFIATLVNLLIGVFYGSIAGYVGGAVGNIMMRFVDIIASIPLTLYVILIMVIFNNGGLYSIILALGLVYWVDMARVVRSQILGLREQEFVFASRTMGSSSWYILRKHLIPNAVGPITVTATMQIPSAIFTEAFLSFIGLGITAPMASWGTMCNDALETLHVAPYQLAFPALAICITMFAFNFIGDGLRDAFDPHMRK